MKKAFLISGVFISSIVGAGFATGNEILFYFSRYSKFGLVGILGSVILFSLFQYIIVAEAGKKRAYKFDDYLFLIMGKKSANIISFISHFFMLIIFSAMLCGFGELLYSLYGIKKIYAVICMIILYHLILKKGYKGFVKSESLLSVFIVLSIIFTGIYILMFREKNVTVFNTISAATISAVSYVGYNILTLSAVLCVLGKEYDEKVNKIAAVITFITMLLIMGLLWYIICIYSGMIDLGAIPLITICKRVSRFLSIFYSLVIFASMLTTAVSNGYTLELKLEGIIGKKLSHHMVLAGGLLLSSLDFSFMVDKIYRVTGVISVYFLYRILKDKYGIKNDILRKTKKNRDNKRNINIFLDNS